MKDFRYLEDVSTLVLDEDRCIGCGLCTEVCPHAVFEMSRNRAKIVDFNACMECGACVNNCPADAISVSPGVGLATYIIQVWIKGKENASCGDGCC
jgi:NAD-dependent dihydropyrimidine dehydrogenase PreA subunit